MAEPVQSCSSQACPSPLMEKLERVHLSETLNSPERPGLSQNKIHINDHLP